MRKNKRLLFATAAASLALASTSSASVITFADFNNLGGGSSFANSVTEDGSGSVTSITQSTVDTDNTNFFVEYTDADGTLTFNLLVEGFTGGSATSSISPVGAMSEGTGGSATLGTTSAAVGTVATATGDAFGVGSGMATGSSLRFSIVSMDYTGGSVVFNSFTSTTFQETGGANHQFVLGVGDSGLPDGGWDGPDAYSITTGNPTVLIVNSAAEGNTATWGVNDIGFQFTTTIPEPGTYALLAGLSGLVFVMLRRCRD
ncbi:PEP-CTERM sorting domain-containing protein [Coraliomargarita algicola]|uniref:PEP-CTERM sorting domain-containing protein n=1 Tax=Coraliomargarita algicola TaxID=3092156 RepID=A0ABZ0RMB1_9BACT|nr:PEP-CTERM sorting domain-containing protein [Coraliomargarita sp. J2-16]WPJ96238.1 PEP-CTERM sorting domain-containing protein [Coraliomargarita sp. J2-16]